jgi:hypothetical protein
MKKDTKRRQEICQYEGGPSGQPRSRLPEPLRSRIPGPRAVDMKMARKSWFPGLVLI